MLNVLEQDAIQMKKFCKAFSSSCQKITNAQTMMISATQELAYYLRMFGDQQKKRPSYKNEPDENKKSDEKNDEKEFDLSENLNQFANHIEEVNN